MDQVYPFGPFVFDAQRRILLRQGSTVAMGQKCLVLLEALLAAEGRVVSKTKLIEAAWQTENIEESNLPVQIAALRKCLGTTPRGEEWIATVQRVGYQFVNPCGTPAHVEAIANGLSLDERPAIAVLPFANLGSDPEQTYFCDAVTEDIIIELTRSRLLSVRSRSATHRYRNSEIDISHIASELKVHYIVEGSVRCIGERMRISVELIDAATDDEVWAEKFDRPCVENVAVQDQLMRTIVSALLGQIHVVAMERVNRKPSTAQSAE
jgi:TolB-like protein